MKIVAFLNAYTQGKSGADVIFAEIYKRIINVELIIITSSLGKKFCIKHNLKAKYVITTDEKKFSNTIYTYIRRIVYGIKIILTVPAVDIVYSTSDALPDVLPASLLSLKLNKPLIGNIFHIIPKSRLISYLTQKISFQLFKWKNAVCFVDNDILIKDLIKQGFNKKQLILRYPGINFSFIQKIKSIAKYNATSMIRIHPSKGIFDLIEIWKKVVTEIPNATLALIGTGEKKYIDVLKKGIAAHKLSKNMKLLGYLHDEEALQFIKGSSIFLFPSHEEGFGMAVGEALACNVPVIAYDLPAFRSTFKKNIYTIPCFNQKLFSRKVVEVLKSKKRFLFQKNVLEKFSWENVVSLETIILKFCSERSA